jgi:hypothetical protein
MIWDKANGVKQAGLIGLSFQWSIAHWWRSWLFNFLTELCTLRMAEHLPFVLLFIIVRTDQINLPECLCVGCVWKVILFLPSKSQTCCRLHFIFPLPSSAPFATCLTNHIVSTYYQAFLQLAKCMFFFFSQSISEFSLFSFSVCFPHF